ncbi:hypothetical protein BpHYR1_009565 [Brachionus plicatilis]|uniref:Uncharacterized protein n=1 Tax=Brachionus plicatilis TaxID=10195 RepID=A0A3M7SQJ9_BRAPC|nr:hypothetical protein BpHYR1_009565 [Brachionus plicatilis]
MPQTKEKIQQYKFKKRDFALNIMNKAINSNKSSKYAALKFIKSAIMLGQKQKMLTYPPIKKCWYRCKGR